VDLLIGLDVGTTATKALLFDLQGRTIAAASQGYGLITPHEGWVEQDAEELWRAVVAVLQAIAARTGAGDRIVALAQSSQGGTTIPVDASGIPTHHAISWMDQRAHDQAQQVRQTCGAECIYLTTGWPLQDGLPLQHIAWLRSDRPATFAATRRFAFVNDWITFRLTGRWCMNPSDASITQLMNIALSDWDDRLLGEAGIRRDQLSPVDASATPVGLLTKVASDVTGLPRDLLVANGAHDQYCAAVATGVTRPGPVLLSCGTAWVLLMVPEDLETGLGSGMAISCHAISGHWGAIRSLGGVGTSLEWFLNQVWAGAEEPTDRETEYMTLGRHVQQSPAGADGLLFFPLAGGHSGAIGTHRGAFAGLSLSHTRGDMARAVMEGIAFELLWAMGEIRDRAMQMTELRMVGGGAESAVWPQIVADITGVPVVLPSSRQAASRGAAILAGVGAGLFVDPEAGWSAFQEKPRRLEPMTATRHLYNSAFANYKDMWEALSVQKRAARTQR